MHSINLNLSPCNIKSLCHRNKLPVNKSKIEEIKETAFECISNSNEHLIVIGLRFAK